MMENLSKVNKILFRLQGHYTHFNKEDIHYSKPNIRISGGTCMCSKNYSCENTHFKKFESEKERQILV